MSTHRNRDIYDVHDARLKFVEILLAPLKPDERARWARKYLPKTSALAVVRRDFEELTR